MNNEIKELIKKITELLNDPKLSKQAKYHLVRAHNELIQVFQVRI
jgi:hypothetical protein